MPAEPPSATKETFRAELERLVHNFAAHEDEYTSPGYPEAQARTDFITPFFRALGWDVENRAGLSYTQREVLEEKGTGEGRPDYTFRIGGINKFIVEAKAPHVSLSVEDHVLQVKSYAWSTREVFAVILTDFEEFRFYDASQKPDPNHPHRGQLLDLTYQQYLNNLDKLWEFSRQRVAEGSIEALLPRDKRALRFRKPVDDSFLEDMTTWRRLLAEAVHKRNPTLDAHALTDIVQRLLDRLIFIRVAEDRRILEKNSLLDPALDWEAIGGRKSLLPMLNDLFHQINDDFNGDIFKFHPCEEIKLDDPALHRIVKQLYPPKSAYRFDVIPVDIFGAVYERYLGKTIYVRGKDVKVQDKPEVRKAGGVYYTPKYIVDYIVKHTVGKIIEGKTPKEIEKIKILDPACGSGSFLLGAFQHLIDYHVAYYEKHPKEAKVHPLYPELVKDGNGTSHLSIHCKAKILYNNLFGVDLDPQAVEITMMNLYLKALEGERDLPHKQQLLPELKFNIRCGNSLIAPDIAKEQKLSQEESQRFNPFDWHSESDGFGHILKHGGFHAVIGNPPYVSFSGRQAIPLSPEVRAYFEQHYHATGWLTLHAFFIVKAHELSAQRVGFVIPDQLGHLDGYESVRSFVTSRSSVVDVRYWGERVFEGVTTPVLTFITDRTYHGLARIEMDKGTCTTVGITSGAAWLPASTHPALLAKLRSQARPLEGAFADPGVHTGNCSRKLILPITKASSDCVPVLEGKQIERYGCQKPTKVLRLGYRAKKGEYFTIRPLHRYTSAPFVIRQTAAYPIVGPRRYADYFRNSLLALYPAEDERDLRFVVAILNSRLMRYIYTASVKEASQKAFPQVKVHSLRSLPIRDINFGNAHEKLAHDTLVKLVDKAIQLNRQKSEAKAVRDRDILDRRIRATDQEIERIVLQLYKLSDEEVAQVETYFASV